MAAAIPTPTGARRRRCRSLPKESPQNDIAVTTQKAEALERRAQELMTQLQGRAGGARRSPRRRTSHAESRAASRRPKPRRGRSRSCASKRRSRAISTPTRSGRSASRSAPAPTEYRFARYVEDWRQKVERVGNLNYPEAARQLKLYGNLILTVSIRADGSVEKVVVDRSSGHKVLDAAATRIVEMAAPYAPFPADIRRDTDILDITRTWTFARGDELRSD